jgi:hypothetical protein
MAEKYIPGESKIRIVALRHGNDEKMPLNHSGIMRRVLFWLTAMILAASTVVDASSLGRRSPLTAVCGVESLRLLNAERRLVPSQDPLVLEVEMAAHRKFTNLRRRWWAISDPNNVHVLDDLSLSDCMSIGPHLYFDNN